MNRRPWAAVVLAALLLAGCSSAPQAPNSIEDRKNRAADYLKFGRNAFQEAQFAQALAFYQYALDLNNAVDHIPGMAAAWNSIATAQTALGKAEDARASLVQAEALAALSGDKTLILQVAVNRIQSLLDQEAYAEVQARLDGLRPFPATAEGAALEHTLGILERDQGHYPEALEAFARAVATNRSLGLKQEEAANRFMRASVNGRLGDWPKARADLAKALSLDKTMENTLGIGQDLRALGIAAQKTGNGQEAFDHFVRAHRVFQAAGLADQQRRTLELLIPAAVALGLDEEKTRYQAVLDRLGPVPGR